jgi:hypothetical protein
VPLAGIYALTAVGVVLALCAPLELGFAVVLGAWMLVPAGLILPGLLHVLLVDRVILGAFALRLILRSGRPGEPPPRAYRLTPVHLALAAMLGVGFVDGVALAPGSVHNNFVVWLTLVDAATLFVVALAVLRTIGVWPVLRAVTAVVAIAAAIGIVERTTGHGWAHFLSEHVPPAYQSSFIFPLATRGGAVRAQAASEFALEFGWVLVMLVPLVVGATITWIERNRSWGGRRQLLLLVPVAAVVAVLLSGSRSAEVGVAVAAVLLTLASGAPRRLVVGVGVAAAVVLVVVGLEPSIILKPFSAANPTSIQSRLQRLPILFSLVVHRPFPGIGYTGYSGVLVGADDSYALTYGQLGVIGLLAWLALLLTTFSTAVRTLRAPVGSATRLLGPACAIGVMSVAVAGMGYDLTFTEQSMWTLALLGAFSVVLSEPLPRRATVGRSKARLLIPALGALVGAAVLALAPVGWSRSYTIDLISPLELATTDASLITWTAQQLGPTVCGYLASHTVPEPGTELRCTEPAAVETLAWPAQVTVTIAGPRAAAVTSEAHRALRAFERYDYPRAVADGPMASGKPAWATTAPLTGAAAGAAIALVVPPLRRRRRAYAVQPALAG